MSIRQLLQRGDGPFPSHPQVGRFFASSSIEDARLRLGRTIERGDGLGVVIGSAGTGKSLLLQVLAAQYRDQLDVVLLACTQVCTRRALLQAILFELGLDYRLRDEGELRLSLLDQLLSAEQGSTGLLLLVDEAQLLPTRLLEELRMMTNVVRGGVPRVRLVLAGLPALEEALASPELESFTQRVAARCYLGPFSREETAQYVRAQIAASGGEPDRLFVPEAWHAIFDATDGVPRLVNQLCSRALWLADAENRTQVDAAVVQAAWSDLQQLPTPWEAAPSPSPVSNSQEVVEFGQLDSEEFSDGESQFDLGEVTGDDAWEQPIESSSGMNQTEDEKWNDQAMPSPASAEVAQRMSPSASVEPAQASGTRQPADQRHSDWECNDPLLTTAQQQCGDEAPQADGTRETVDPFADSFDEEEVVLDNFATWDSAQDVRSPRVENRRNRGFSTLVQQAIDASAVEVCDPDTSRSEPNRSTPSQPQRPGEDSSVQRPRVRLAVVPEPAPLRPIPVVTSAADKQDSSATAAESMAMDYDPQELLQTPDMGVSAGKEEDILVVDEESDELAEADPTARSEKYWQLFSRLRGE